MKTSRFSDSQIIAVLKQAEGGSPVPELCRELGISSTTFYKGYVIADCWSITKISESIG